MKKIYIIACCLFLFSCSNKTPTEIALTSNILELNNTEVPMRFPYRVTLNDSILYVVDLKGIEYFVHSFSYPSMEYISSLAKHGQGPDEYINLGGFMVDSNNLYLLDANSKRLDIYDKRGDTLVSSVTYPREIPHISAVINMPKKGLLAIDYTGENRLMLLDDHGNIVSKNFSIVNDDAEVSKMPSNAQAVLHTALIDYNPNNHIAVVASHLGELLEIYDMDKMKRKVAVGEGGTPKMYHSDGGKEYGEIYGYLDVKVGNNKIYTIFSGLTKKEEYRMEAEGQLIPNGGDKILVYDLEGNIIQRYKLDRHIYGFWIDEENKRIYAIDNNEDKPLYYFDIPDEV